MDEWMTVRSLALRIAMPGEARLVQALDGWADAHGDWLGLGEDRSWAAALTALRALAARDGEPQPHVLAAVDRLAAGLDFGDLDRDVLRLLVAVARLPRPAALLQAWSEAGRSVPQLLGEARGLAAPDAERALRRSAPLRLMLVGFSPDRQGRIEVEIHWPLERMLDRAADDSVDAVETLVGARQPAHLALADFAHVADADYLVRLLSGAVAQRAAGINILIYGPAGTGKTELARTLAEAAGIALYGVGEADDEGSEPQRWERVNALQLAQRLLARHGGSALLFDEMEDLVGDARPSGSDWLARRQGSKVFVNRMLEGNAVPVIWTTNAIGNVEAAILRRMSFVLKLDLPAPQTARRMAARIAAEEGIAPAAAMDDLLDRAPETATVLRVAARSARLAGEADGGVRAARSAVEVLRGGALPPGGPSRFDPDLVETDVPLAPLLQRLAEAEAADVSLLLTGPPGTGKTALAHRLALLLDRPLSIKRSSDLLSRWVGGTEQAIAAAFAEARERGAVLFFDEADSLLFDRGTAVRSWEAGQVNEMLSWLDSHPLPVVAATNHRHRLDPAVLRRFVFKLDLQPLGPARAAQAFERSFGLPAPAGLAHVAGLTPGDFAVVARQLRYAPAADAEELLERLRAEVALKPGATGRIGF